MATSKREEERNEKIIRGLMKLPPNRRCINCNSLGPQYVCCNFWTFVCTTCSGIHREFTHRVKSVSMSKFTSQEVEALQNGGNQRARETYLKDWDLQRQRFPNSSDADKVREFIKAVYVNRKYASGNKSDNPTKVSQTERNDVDDIRRASSYHSYSQSPPYDFQYEDRLNRKQGGFLSRKPGSDRGQYVRKAASFVYSPGRFSDNLSEDRFANEGTSSRVSDYSASSGGDPFRSAPQSPKLQRDDGFSSPTFESSKELVDGLQHQRSNSSSEMFATRDADKIPVPRPQKIVSSGNFASFSKNPGSLQSVDPATSSAPCSSQAVDFFQSPTALSIQPDQTSSSSSLSYFTGDSQCPTNFISKLPQQPETANDGWATFDLPQPIKPPSIGLDTGISGTHPKDGSSFKKLESFSSPNDGMQCPDFQSTTVHRPGPLISNPWTEDLQNTHDTTNITSTQVPQSTTVHRPGPLISNPWTEDLQNTHVTTNMTSSQPWNAFGETDVKQQQQMEVQGTDLPISVGNSGAAPNLFVEPWSAFGETDVKHMQHVDMHGAVLQTSVEDSSSALNLFPEDSTTPDHQKLASTEVFSFPDLSSHLGSTLPFNQPIYPFRSDVADIEQKSSNPFDVSFDSSFEASNSFLSMSSLQAALPKTTLPSPYAVGLNDSWFPPNPMDSQGGMSYMAAQPTSPRLSNIPTHGPAASVGGNPFA